SLPVPAAQPCVTAFVLAAVIASRRTQTSGAPVSANESTVIGAACADVPSASAKVTIIAATSAAGLPSAALIPAIALADISSPPSLNPPNEWKSQFQSNVAFIRVLQRLSPMVSVTGMERH